MSSDTLSQTPEARELSLVSKVELKIALADSGRKLEPLLDTYLAPLLLKLGSESLAVRNKVIAVCQHVNMRLQDPSIKLPVPALLKQFKEQKSHLIRHFDLIYIQQGVNRLEPETRTKSLLPLLEGISDIRATRSHEAIIFNLILRLLPLLELPAKGSADDSELRHKLGLSSQDTQFLSSWFGKLLVFSPMPKNFSTCPGLSPQEYAFLNKEITASEVWDPSTDGGLNLTETKTACLKLLASGTFTNDEKLLPAIIASADTNSRIVDLGEEILKRFTPDLENDYVVQQLYSLYFGREADGAPPSSPALRTKALAFLGRSIRATVATDNISRLIESGLLSDDARSSIGLQASKLRAQIFNFMTWVTRMGSSADLGRIAPNIIKGLRDFILSQGWPSPDVHGNGLPATDLNTRGLAYESIGAMIPKTDLKCQEEANGRLIADLVSWLFVSLSSDDSGPQISVSVERALGYILNSSLDNLNKIFEGASQVDLRVFLTRQLQLMPGDEDPTTGFKIIRTAHYAAVRFANRFLPYHDVCGRFIDLMAIARGSGRQQELVDEGKKGLHPYWYRLLNPKAVGQTPKPFPATRADDTWYEPPSFTEMSHFLLDSVSRDTRLSGPLTPRTEGAAFVQGVTFLRNILLWESFSKTGIAVEAEHDWEHKLDALLASDEQARLALKKYIRACDKQAIQVFLNGTIDGIIFDGQNGLQQCGQHFVNICTFAPDDVVQILLPRALELKGPMYSSDRDRQDIAARAFGILFSHPSFPDNDFELTIVELINSITAWKAAIGQSVLKLRGAILGVTYLFSRLALRGLHQRVHERRAEQLIDAVFDIIETARDPLLKQSAQMAIGQLGLAGIVRPMHLPVSRWKDITGKLAQDAKAESESSITAMGLLSLIFSKGNTADAQYYDLLDALYSLYEVRSPEIHFTIGDALSAAAMGWGSRSLIQEFDVDGKVPKSSLSGRSLITMCDKLISDSRASKPSLRKASAIWLLCLVKNCGHSQIMQERLRQCQAAFTGLLGDRDEIVQESGAQGLSLVYGMGDQDLKYDLVQDLVDSFTSNKPGLAGGKVDTDTELFEPGALPTGSGPSVNTYKDIMSLASEAGDPTLVYRFMSLASNNAIWTNRAAFSKLGISNIFSDSNINGYLAKHPKIYPKLFRYRFDPNANVRRSMSTIWEALVKDPAAVLDAHFDEIMEDLLKSILAGREWRVRQASCAAISDLIQTHKSDKYAIYITEIFNKAFRLLDDIKESVRVAALELCQTITNSVIRTLESSNGKAERAKGMLERTIPFLLGTKGLESSVAEVQSFAIGSLVRMIKKSPGELIRPFIPRILEQFLSSLSSIEPQAINYVHLNADKYGLTGQDIDKIRLSSIRTSPMMEVIERFLIDGLDEESLKEFVPRLESVLRSAIGLPSKVGCSRVLVLLSMKSTLFQIYADRFIQVLRKLVVDRNDTVTASYCMSIGYLSRLGSGDQVLKTIGYAIDLYTKTEDAHERVVAAEILHSMSKLSNDRFMAFATAALPFVFVSKNDMDEQVRDILERTWQENVGSSRAVLLYIKEIVATATANLDSPRWPIKHTAALAIASAVKLLDAEIDLATCELVWPALEKALAGKTWEGKELVIQALAKFAGQAKVLWQEKRQSEDSLKTIAIREAKRNNPKYRAHALRALGGISLACDNLDFMDTALDTVQEVIDHLQDHTGDEMDIDLGNSHNKSGQHGTLAACVECLLLCLGPKEPVSAPGTYMKQATPVIRAALDHGNRDVQTTMYKELRALFTRIRERSGPVHSDDRKLELSALEGPLTDFTGELFQHAIDSPIEVVRKERAQTAAAYLTFCRQGGIPVSERLIDSIRSWSEGERSLNVQQILEETWTLPK